MPTPDLISFYDIASGPPVTSFAPNPFKARLALNFKGVNYKTEWVELPDVTAVRKSLGAAPVRSHSNGEPFYTLPVIKNTSTGEIVGDSFDIAVYLDKTYPDGPPLFPPGTVGLHAAFNAQVDAVFSSGALLFSHGMPFHPESAEVCKAEFLRRLGLTDWEQLTVRGEERRRVLETYKTSLGELAKFISREDGPFVGGKEMTYADLIVGGWLRCLKITVKEWDEITTWHDGLWGKLDLALEQYAQVK